MDTYIVKSMPQAVAYFGRDNNEKGSMSIGEMKAQGGIACRQECCGFKMKYLTTSFRFRIFRNDGKLMLDKIVENENYFSPATNQLLETIQPGDEILFSEIKYQDNEIDEKGKNIIRSVANPYIRIKIR